MIDSASDLALRVGSGPGVDRAVPDARVPRLRRLHVHVPGEDLQGPQRHSVQPDALRPLSGILDSEKLQTSSLNACVYVHRRRVG